MKKFRSFVLAAFAGGIFATTQPAGALTIEFDYSNDASGFFTPEAKSTLATVANLYGGLITTHLAPIAPSGGNTWTASYSNQADSGVTEISIPNLSIPSDTIIIYLGTTDPQADFYSGTSVGYSSAAGSDTWLDTLQNRAIAGGNRNFQITLWGAALYVNPSYDWNVGMGAPRLGQCDLYSVALQAVGLALGFADLNSWSHWTSLADAQSGVFTGMHAIDANGGVSPKLDGNCWDSNLTSQNILTGAPEQPGFSFYCPDIEGRKELTSLDVAALQDLGWSVVPEPTVFVLLISGLLFLSFGCISRKSPVKLLWIFTHQGEKQTYIS
jgi:hypothetical protein